MHTIARNCDLPVFKSEFEYIAQESAKEHLDYEQFLLKLLEREYEVRLENRKKELIRQAGFPSRMHLHDLKREFLPADALAKLPMLERLDFIKSGKILYLLVILGQVKHILPLDWDLKLVYRDIKFSLHLCTDY